MTRRLRTQTSSYLGLAVCLALTLLTRAMEEAPSPRENRAEDWQVEGGEFVPPVDPTIPVEKRIRYGKFLPLEDPTIPVTVMIGKTGAGKSTFGSMMARLVSDGNVGVDDAIFVQNGTGEAGTTAIQAKVIDAATDEQSRMIRGRQLMLIDTPGLADPCGQDKKIRVATTEFLNTYKKEYGHKFGVNSFAVIYSKKEARFHEEIQQMVKYFCMDLGVDILDNVAIVVTSWPYNRFTRRVMLHDYRAKMKKPVTIEEVKENLKQEIQKVLVAAIQKATEDEINPLHVLPERLAAIKDDFFLDKIFFVDSQYDVEVETYDAKYAEAKEDVGRLLDYMASRRRHPCDHIRDSNDVMTDLEKGQARAQKMDEEVRSMLAKVDAIGDDGARRVAQMIKEHEEMVKKLTERMDAENMSMEQRLREQRELTQQTIKSLEEIQDVIGEYEKRIAAANETARAERANQKKVKKQYKAQCEADEERVAAKMRNATICKIVAVAVAPLFPPAAVLPGGLGIMYDVDANKTARKNRENEQQRLKLLMEELSSDDEQ